LSQLLLTLADDPVGGILAVPVADTLKRANGEQRIAATEPRDGLWQAQTPQMFRYGLLRQALDQCRTVTDEASAVEALGLSPRLVPGESTNLKVTYPADLAMAGLILRGQL
jgi:2-C-methyl-D-erythritol 4-phosphate cytidylyltransferase